MFRCPKCSFEYNDTEDKVTEVWNSQFCERCLEEWVKKEIPPLEWIPDDKQ